MSQERGVDTVLKDLAKAKDLNSLVERYQYPSDLEVEQNRQRQKLELVRWLEAKGLKVG